MDKKTMDEIEKRKSKLKADFCSGTDILINDWSKLTRRELKKELLTLKKTVDLSSDPVNRQFFEIGNLIYKAKFNKELSL